MFKKILSIKATRCHSAVLTASKPHDIQQINNHKQYHRKIFTSQPVRYMLGIPLCNINVSHSLRMFSYISKLTIKHIAEDVPTTLNPTSEIMRLSTQTMSSCALRYPTDCQRLPLACSMGENFSLQNPLYIIRRFNWRN